MRALVFASASFAALVALDAACTIMNDRMLPLADGGKRSHDGVAGGDDDDDDGDGGPTVTPTQSDGGCDPFAPFVDLGVGPFARVNDALDESFVRLSVDELTLYFSRLEGGDKSGLYTGSRPNLQEPFDGVTRLDLGDHVCCGSPSPDGLRLYFAQYTVRSENPDEDIYSIMVADRPTRDARFTNPRVVLAGDTTLNFTVPVVALEGTAQKLYFGRNDKNVTDLFRVALDPGTGMPVGSPVSLGSVNTTGENFDPTPSADGLTLYFYSDVDNEKRGEIFVSHRASLAAPFSPPAHVPEILRPLPDGYVSPGYISRDNCRLYYYQGETLDAQGDLRMATRAASVPR